MFQKIIYDKNKAKNFSEDLQRCTICLNDF